MSFCFGRLMDGITRYKEEKLSYVGGCLIYLQVLYINSVIYGKNRKDASMCPVVRWDADGIRRFIKWLDMQGGVGTEKVALCGSVMKGCKVVDHGGESDHLVNREQKEYSNAKQIGQWPHELHADVADINKVAAEMICQIKDI